MPDMKKYQVTITDTVNPGESMVHLRPASGGGCSFVRRSADKKAPAVLSHELELSNEVAAELRCRGYEVSEVKKPVARKSAAAKEE